MAHEIAEVCSTTHHTFLVGPWKDAGDGAVVVTELDDEDCVVLILKPCDVDPFIAALVAARQGTPIPIDVSQLAERA